MEDDLDDLLDEVESKFCKDSSAKSTGKSNPKNSQANRTKAPDTRRHRSSSSSSRATRKQAGGDDLNDIIRDICTDEGPEIPALSPPGATRSSISNPKESSLHKSKCLNLFLGGTRFVKGLCTLSEKRTCDQLRCTSCDFKVVMFDNYEWQKDCDYLFFRNNVPDFQKLSSKLISRKGFRAYACQCTWQSIIEQTDILSDSKLKWVCGKHS